jgi:hypothetical protein
MPGDATQIVVAQNARVYLAPVGTAALVDTVATPADPWFEVGLFTPDSLSWATDPSFQEVNSHQSNYPTRRFQTGEAATVQVDLQQWNGDNFKSVYGGGTLTKLGTTPNFYYKFVPPAIGGRSEVAAMVEIIDGTKVYRRWIPRCAQNEGVTQALNKTSESILPLRLTILGSDSADPWYDISNDVNFAP